MLEYHAWYNTEQGARPGPRYHYDELEAFLRAELPTDADVDLAFCGGGDQ